ncbi:MAG: hypothetical protein L5655_07570 [Thermosediminibacteraceae bacterium]|nr:hypothetical protein [Thermosediminibacteraceae bacterium]
MNTISSLLDGKVLNIFLHFYKRIKETPLLVGYIVVGLAITINLYGFKGLTLALKNLFLLLIWALIIRIMTEGSPEPVKIKNLKLELCIAFLYIGYLFIIATYLHILVQYS